MRGINHVVGSVKIREALGQWVLFGVFAIVGSIATFACVSEVRAACQDTLAQSYSNNGVAVPCSNTAFCNPYTTTRLCEGGAYTLAAYKNTNPPAGWCRCGPAMGTNLTCGEDYQVCGTTVYYSDVTCALGTSCDAADGESLNWCKCK